MFAEDLSVFTDPDGLGEAALVDGVAVNGIYERAFELALDGMVADSAPRFTCAAADVPSVHAGSTVVVDGTSFTVAGPPQPDGAGMVALRLQVSA